MYEGVYTRVYIRVCIRVYIRVAIIYVLFESTHWRNIFVSSFLLAGSDARLVEAAPPLQGHQRIYRQTRFRNFLLVYMFADFSRCDIMSVDFQLKRFLDNPRCYEIFRKYLQSQLYFIAKAVSAHPGNLPNRSRRTPWTPTRATSACPRLASTRGRTKDTIE